MLVALVEPSDVLVARGPYRSLGLVGSVVGDLREDLFVQFVLLTSYEGQQRQTF